MKHTVPRMQILIKCVSCTVDTVNSIICEQDQYGTGLVLLLVGYPARKLSANLYDI